MSDTIAETENILIDDNATGGVGITIGDSDTGGSLTLSDGSSNTVGISVPALTSDYTLVLPADDGDSGEVLSTDGSGNLSWTAASGGGATVYDVDTPLQFSGNQNAYFLSTTNTVFRLDPSGNALIRGFDSAGFSDGQMVIVINVSSNNLQLRNQATQADAEDRIITPGGNTITLSENGSATLIYDGTSNRWRVISTN
jgi:hypothetical protein